MIQEPGAMPQDAETLRDVIEDRGVSVKALAYRLGVNKSTIYKYLSGDLAIQPIVLRTAFEMTYDSRIVELVTGPIPVVVQLMELAGASDATSSPLRIPPIDQLLREAASAVESAAKSLPHVGDVLSDGKVDARDRVSIDRFRKQAADVNLKFAQISAALDAHLSRSTKEAV